MHIDRELTLCKPQPAGDCKPDEYFSYSGNLESCEKIANENVPKYKAVDDSGNQYQLPYENGWLIEFKRLFGKKERWVIFAYNEMIYVDTGNGLYCFSNGEIKIDAKMIFCFAKVTASFSSGKNDMQFWIKFPWLRTWFIDGDTKVEECEPLCDIFQELSTNDGVSLWTSRWTSGIAVRSSAIKKEN